MSRHARPPGARLARVASLLAAAGALAGCFTGERPTLTPTEATTGDAAADAVLERLARAGAAPFSADYSIATPLGEQADAVVAQAGATRRSVTIGGTRYLVDGATTATCAVDTGACTGSLDPARISNLAVTPEFYDASAASRLRRDVGQRVAATEASTETIAGQPAACVTIPIARTATRYCALDAGPLASMRTTDVTIELTSFSPEPDPALLAEPAN